MRRFLIALCFLLAFAFATAVEFEDLETEEVEEEDAFENVFDDLEDEDEDEVDEDEEVSAKKTSGKKTSGKKTSTKGKKTSTKKTSGKKTSTKKTSGKKTSKKSSSKKSTKLGAPTKLAVDSQARHTIRITWTAPKTTGIDGTKLGYAFVIWDVGFHGGAEKTVIHKNVTSWAIKDLERGHQYFMRLRAVHPGFTRSEWANLGPITMNGTNPMLHPLRSGQPHFPRWNI